MSIISHAASHNARRSAPTPRMPTPPTVRQTRARHVDDDLSTAWHQLGVQPPPIPRQFEHCQQLNPAELSLWFCFLSESLVWLWVCSAVQVRMYSKYARRTLRCQGYRYQYVTVISMPCSNVHYLFELKHINLWSCMWRPLVRLKMLTTVFDFSVANSTS